MKSASLEKLNIVQKPRVKFLPEIKMERLLRQEKSKEELRV